MEKNKYAMVQLSYKPKRANHPRLLDAQQCYNVFKSVYDEGQIEYKETFYVALLDTRGRLNGILEVARGNERCVAFDYRGILQAALLSNSKNVIAFHNHPSGDQRPSSCDRTLTEDLKKKLNCIDVTLLDHIIVCVDDYYSFNKAGLL